ncbi:hypothetical protein DCO48_12270 [Pseudomonas sp. SDI]|uniref:hypothetical protein n=1 Tax=Pseudomonas sp. SDI TaxID=2170734 RepID=UPI000DE7A9F0|nr:hypothetical protein [Pseudomonas sp. SDI]PWB32890.1 hypothetical protein DCO48_12270 [Pseudomonas sp. SDI]
MTLREKLLDAVIDGQLGNGLVVTRQAFIHHFKEVTESYTGVFLANSEISQDHSPTYEKFTQRLEVGVYRIHPQALLERMNERKLA